MKNLSVEHAPMSKVVPFLDYKAVNQLYFEEIQQAVNRVLKSGWYVLGPEVEAFEHEFAEYCGAKYCVGVSSGLDALILILEAWKLMGRLKEGNEVIVPANTYRSEEHTSELQSH